MTVSRRSFITGLVSFVAAAPAIVRAPSLMPIRTFIELPRPLDDLRGGFLVPPEYASEIFELIGQVGVVRAKPRVFSVRRVAC